MKKFFTIVSLAVLTIGLLGSCEKDDSKSKEPVIETVGDALPADFPEDANLGWIKENSNDHFCYRFVKAQGNERLMFGANNIVGAMGISLSWPLTKSEDGRSYSCKYDVYTLTFNMTTDGKLESITLADGIGKFESCNGTYKPRP